MLSKDLNEYGQQKGVAITAGKRMVQFLGSDSAKGPGLCCLYVIARKPANTPVTERALPISIFEAEPSVRHSFLRKWLKDNSLKEEDLEMKKIIDWDYYKERFGSTVQKLIVIPSVL